MLSCRLFKGQFYILYQDLRSYPSKFFRYFRMSIDTFDKLVNTMRPVLEQQDTSMRKCHDLISLFSSNSAQ